MGQQQLLLIIVAVIIVGIAIAMGINLFTASATDNKRDLVINECINLASLAQHYYMRPQALGGGGRSFTGWTVPYNLVQTVNGSYQATVNDQNIVLLGTGNEIVSGNDSIKVQVTIYSQYFETEIIN